jgi:large subunit ribosomal protein L22
MRQMADLVRGKDVDIALHSLRVVTKASARPMEKLITSAVANAREKANAADERFDADAFFVKTVLVDEGPTMKRFRPRAQGRAYRIRKRSCHVHLVLGERAVKKKATKPPVAAAKAATPAPAASAKKAKSAGTDAKRGAKRAPAKKTAAGAKK